MKLHSLFLPAALAVALATLPASAAEPDAANLSAKELAGRLNALRQDGNSLVRLRLEVKQPPDTTRTALQIQIKERRTRAGGEAVYQVLWPKERKGEAVLLRAGSGRAPSGSIYVPPGKPKPLGAAQMTEGLFGSDLAYQDVIENFFAWDNQTITGTEVINRVSCLVLESKPGKDDRSIYGSVRSWIDPRRLVPLRVEKYSSSGRKLRTIETTRVATDDRGRPVPANLTVHGPRADSVTELDGSRIKHDVNFADREFSAEGLTELSAAKPAAE